MPETITQDLLEDVFPDEHPPTPTCARLALAAYRNNCVVERGAATLTGYHMAGEWRGRVVLTAYGQYVGRIVDNELKVQEVLRAK